MTRVTGGSLPRIAVGTSTMLGSRYTRGAPPLVGMRMATPAVRAAPPAALLTACFAGGCDGGAAGARDRQPQSARLARRRRSEEHTSELQSRFGLVCRLLLEKKNLCIS